LYCTIFMSYFRGSTKTPPEQARDIIDVVFRGILSESELEHFCGTTQSAGKN